MGGSLTRCVPDIVTRRAILKAPEELTRGRKKETPGEMWAGYKTFEGIRRGEYFPPASFKDLSPEALARQRRDPSLAMLDDLIAHPAVFHTPLQEKGDCVFAMLHANLMTLRVDGRCKAGVLNRYPVQTFGTAFAVGSPVRFPDYRKIRFHCLRGLPLVTADWVQAGAEWRLESFVAGAGSEQPGSYAYERVLWEKLSVRNPLSRPLRLNLFKCFASAPRQSFGLCHYNRFNGYPATAWRNESLRLAQRKNEIFHQGRMICRVDHPPQVSFRLVAVEGNRHPDSFRTKEKVPRFGILLAPGESVTLAFRTCFSDRSWDGPAARRIRKLDYSRERSKCIRRWKSVLSRGALLSVPEARIMSAWQAQRVCLHQFHHRFTETDDVLFPNQGPAWPMSFWAGEARFCIRAFDQLGLHAQAAKVIEYFIRTQIEWTGPFKGDVSTLTGAFDSTYHWMQDTGVMLGAMGRHYLLSGDRGWLKAKAGSALAALEWIHLQRRLTKNRDAKGRPARHYGLLPNARANDGEDEGYFYAFTDCPTWDGLNMMIQALKAGNVPIPAHLRGEREDYRRCIQKTIRAVMKLFPGTDFVPHVVYPPKGKQPWYWSGSMLIALGSGVAPRSSALFRDLYGKVDRYLGSGNRQVLGLCDRLDDVMLNSDGGPRCGIKGTEWYLTAAEQERHRMYLARNEVEKALLNLYTLVAFALTDTLQSSERLNLVDPYWAPVQVNPSGSARIISMIGESIVFETGRALSVFRGIPRAWLEPGRHVSLKGWKTVHGAVACDVRVDRSGDRMHGSVALAGRRAPIGCEIVLRHPAGKPIRSVSVNGKPYGRFKRDRIVFPSLPGRVKFGAVF